MKTKAFFTIAAAAVAVLASCSRTEEVPAEHLNDGAISLRVLSGQSGTKADANTNETTLTDVKVFVFNASDELYRYYSLKSDEMTAGSCVINNLKTGTYSMYVVANGPAMASTVQNKAQLLATAIELGAYNSASSDFVMCGYEEGIIISADNTTNVTVEISRFVSRVTLSSIKNNLPASIGEMTVNYAVLSNVAGNQTVGGDAATSTWYNKDCRADETTRDAGHIIGVGAYEASCKDVTFASYAQTVTNGNSCTTARYFYGYPNPLTAKGNGFSNSYTPKATCLDISITFSVAGTSHTYWYNVPILGTSAVPGIARNYDYDVKVIISGEGADEPGKYTEKGKISATITIKDWVDGTSTYVEI